jgi:hypothetical protein
MIRKAILKRNVNTSEIHHVIGHNGSVFFKIFLIYLWVLAALILLFLVLDRYVTRPYLKWVFAWAWLIALAKFCIDFFDIYLDSIVLLDTWIVLYLWEWLLEYKTERFERDKIESIWFNQKWIWDKLFMKGDILIRLEHWVEFPFENITNPKKQADKILQYKWRFVAPVNTAKIQEQENKKFDVLVEALWEVVKDYIDKWEDWESREWIE